MLTCQQFDGMNVLEHGRSVREWYLKLMSGETPLPEWAAGIKVTDHEAARLYQIYHDCGKHLCQSIDAEGRRHFTGHADASADLWESLAEDTEQDRLIGRLIRMDMDAHTIRGEEQIAEFITRTEAPILLLTAVAEVYSNASYLGRLGSDDFKIKLKRICRIGKKYAAVAQRRERESLKLPVAGSNPASGTKREAA
jgi:hypothetical protein